jgi:hypothetical protein
MVLIFLSFSFDKLKGREWIYGSLFMLRNGAVGHPIIKPSTTIRRFQGSRPSGLGDMGLKLSLFEAMHKLVSWLEYQGQHVFKCSLLIFYTNLHSIAAC